MRRIAGRLVAITDEKEFPKAQREVATNEFEKYGFEMAKILPQYFDAVLDHHREYDRHKETIKEQELAQQMQNEQEKRLQEEAEEQMKMVKAEKARELEARKKALVEDPMFLVKQNNKGKNKKAVDGMDEELIDPEAVRGKKKGKSAKKQKEEEDELVRCMEVFLAPSDDEDQGSHSSQYQG